jgi:hypothetical protein
LDLQVVGLDFQVVLNKSREFEFFLDPEFLEFVGVFDRNFRQFLVNTFPDQATTRYIEAKYGPSFLPFNT